MDRKRKAGIKSGLGTGVVLLVVAGLGYLIVSSLLAPSPTNVKRIQQITLVMPPPPPPVEQPPEPQIEEKVEVPEMPTEPVEADAAPSPDLGLDADGSGNGDGFGLMAKKGGRDITEGNPFDWYAGVLSSDISAALNQNSQLRRQKYRVTLKLWIGANGRIERAELSNTTGDRSLDAALRVALSEISRVREAPPLEMPQPVKLQLTSRL